MEHTAYVTISKRIPHYFDLTVRIPECQAVCYLDAGKTELQAIRFERALFELRAYRRMGYKLKFLKVRKV